MPRRQVAAGPWSASLLQLLLAGLLRGCLRPRRPALAGGRSGGSSGYIRLFSIIALAQSNEIKRSINRCNHQMNTTRRLLPRWRQWQWHPYPWNAHDAAMLLLLEQQRRPSRAPQRLGH